MSDFISAGAKFVCPACNRLQLFERSVPEEALPIAIRCSTPECGYQLTYAKDETKPVFPKIDPMNRVHGNWVVEIQQSKEKDYWKPIGGQYSFRERCNMIATHLAGGLQIIETLHSELRRLADMMTQQFQTEWGMHVGFLRMWNPGRVENWVKQPFVAFPINCEDKFLNDRTRLFIHPNFFVPRLGFPLKSYGGFNAQLITPYLLIEFPLETWMRNLLNILPIPDLRVVGDRLVGRDLIHCWRDIPGTVPDIDHNDDAPLLKIIDSLKARTWLARLGVCPWRIGQLTEEHAFKALSTYFQSDTPKKFQVDTFHQFKEHGRLALFCEQPSDAWELALTIGSFMYGQKLVLVSSLEYKDNYTALVRESNYVKANTSFHWKSVKDGDIDDLPWEQISYVVIGYDDEFPPEVLEKLYRYNGRLIVISQNPLMDMLDTNWEAARFYGLVAKSIWHPDLPALNAPFDYTKGQDSLVSAILANWHDDSKITKGRAIL